MQTTTTTPTVTKMAMHNLPKGCQIVGYQEVWVDDRMQDAVIVTYQARLAGRMYWLEKVFLCSNGAYVGDTGNTLTPV